MESKLFVRLAVWEDQSKHPQSVSSGVSRLTPSRGQFLQKRQVTTTLLASRKISGRSSLLRPAAFIVEIQDPPRESFTQNHKHWCAIGPVDFIPNILYLSRTRPLHHFSCCGGLTLPTSELGRPPKIGPYLMAGRELTSSLTCQTIATSHYLALVHSVHAYDLFWEAMSPILLGTNQCHHTFSLFFLL